jgi:hypothetical protein
MGRREASSRSRYQGVVSSTKQNSSGVVSHVILNADDKFIPEIRESETNPKPIDSYIGHAIIKKHTDFSSADSDGESYAPFDPSEGLPLIGETVALIYLGGTPYYTRIPNRDINRGNAKEDKSQTLSPNTETPSNQASNYNEVSQTKTPAAAPSSAERKSKLGEYFEPTDINQLVLYEGDKVIQSRFGQSIRFSGYNNAENIFSPTIIIRNRQNDESLQTLQKNELVEEDINKDGSTILLSSNDYKLDFQPGLVDDGGNSDFETTPINFTLPEEYVGFDQMLLNSERVIISAKSQEMIFFSKGNYGFISDGKFTIDNGNGGADLDFGDDVNITTDRNDGNFFINTGDGNILLNTTETEEPLVRGNTLVELLGELIDAINQQVYNTPAGPSAVGPTNRSTFNDIKSKLQDALSTLNYTE